MDRQALEQTVKRSEKTTEDRDEKCGVILARGRGGILLQARMDG